MNDTNRKRVKRVFEQHGHCTMKFVSHMLPGMMQSHIRSTMNSMQQTGCIVFAGYKERCEQTGRMLKVWKLPDPVKRREQQAGPPGSEPRRKFADSGVHCGAAFRDDKVRVLKRCAARASNIEKDLLIGILRDYGHHYK